MISIIAGVIVFVLGIICGIVGYAMFSVFYVSLIDDEAWEMELK